MTRNRVMGGATCLMLAMIAAGTLPACGENGVDGVGGSCEADIAAKADALQASVQALGDVAGSMQAELSLACSKLAGEAGDDSLRDDDLKDKCGEASAMISAEIDAGAAIEYVPGQCSVEADAQFDCEAGCSVEGNCDPGSVEVRCDPGELSVECEGSCEGTATCEGSASASVACEGECNGTCTGSCSGTCNGECDGECTAMNSEGMCEGECTGECNGSCSASCEGSCEGSCKFAADAQVECDATLRCEGGCDGTATAPKCEGKLDPPECNLDADCQAACDGEASFNAECTPPTVTITGFADVDYAATVQANLPAVLKVAAQAELVANAMADVVSAAGAVGDEITASVSCVADYGTEFVTDLQAAAEASASVSVSVEASADVSGSASGG